MANKLIIISFCFCIVSNINAQKVERNFSKIITKEQNNTNDRAVTTKLIPYRVGDKWGYADSKRNLILPAQYDSAGIFGLNTQKIDSVAKVILNNNSFYINLQGNKVQIDSITDDTLRHKEFALITLVLNNIQKELNQKLYFFRQDDKFGFRIKNDTILPAVFFDHGIYSDSVLALMDNRGWRLYNDSGKPISKYYDEININRFFPVIIVKKKNKYGLIDGNGEIVVKPRYDKIYQYAENTLVAKKNKHYRLISNNGKPKVNKKYKNINVFYYDVIGYYWATNKNGESYWIDNEGNEFFTN